MIDDHVIHTGGDGVLGGDGRTSPAEVAALAARCAAADHVVLHLHGGLVDDEDGRQVAGSLLPFYADAGTHPVFPVWETGLLETLRNNLHELAHDRLFEALVKRLAGWLVARGSAAERATVVDVEREMRRRERSLEEDTAPVPFADADLRGLPPALSDEEARRFEAEVAADRAIAGAAARIAAAFRRRGAAEAAAPGAAGLTPELARALDSPAEAAISDAVAVARLAPRLLARVLDRIARGRDHGLYATVVEEVIRGVWLDHPARHLWASIKKDASDTFEADGGGQPRGGWLFVRELGQRIAATGRRPRLSVVAHSAGSIWACHLVEHLARCRSRADHPLPADFALGRVAFLAPAVDAGRFDRTLTAHADVMGEVRLFSLRDALERGYWEIPVLYPASLLYFVSGVTEDAVDAPLVGMERYFTHEDVYREPAMVSLRRWVAQDPRRTVWSEVDGGPGLRADSVRHGGFVAVTGRDATMRSVRDFLQHERRGRAPGHGG
ncbi:MAG: hypothetical protein ACFCGT_14180 [Sandaracinaceae bacterium]